MLPPNLQARWQEGLRLFEAHQMEAAEQIFLEISRGFPEFLEALFMLALVAVNRQNWTQAIARLQQGLALQPQSLTFRYHLAKVLELNAQWEEAEAQYQQILQAEPGQVQALVHLGEIRLKQGDLDGALTYAEQALQVQPAAVEALFLKGEVRQRQSELKAARSLYQEVLSLKPEHLLAERNLALVWQELEHPEQAIIHYERALRKGLVDPQVWNNLGRAQHQNGNAAQALAAYREAIRLRPDFARYYYNAALMQMELGQKQAAINLFQEYLSRAPEADDRALIYVQLAQLHRECQEWAEAIHYFDLLWPEHADLVAAGDLGHFFLSLNLPGRARPFLERALEQEPQKGDLRFLLAYACQLLGEGQEAITHFQRLHQDKPENIRILVSLATSLRYLGELEQAQKLVSPALKEHSHDPDLLSCQASILERKQRYQEAFELLDVQLAEHLGHEEFSRSYATLCLRLGRAENAVETLELAVKKAPPLSPQGRSLRYLLGAIYEQMERYEEAFACFEKANTGRLEYFDREQYRHDFNLIQKTFTADFLAQLPRAQRTAKRPIFIVGMPRSGTSLVEQILAAHTEVAPGGELNMLSPLPVANLPQDPEDPEAIQAWLDDWERIPQLVLDLAAETYLAALDKVSANSLYITDKMPSNFQFLHLVELLFPEAVVIHCRRHPLDTAISCFSQDFATQSFTHNLSDLHFYYDFYLRQMAHWRRTLTRPLLEVRYEDLVREPEVWIRKLVAHCQLDWQDDCLRFYQQERFVRTPSYHQVVQPIYQSSVGRYQHYRKPLKELEDLVPLAGYDLEDPWAHGPEILNND